MQYVIIDCEPAVFSYRVEDMLRAGWQLQGGVAAVRVPPGVEAYCRFGDDHPYHFHGGVMFYQSMTHEDDDAKVPDSCAGDYS